MADEEIVYDNAAPAVNDDPVRDRAANRLHRNRGNLRGFRDPLVALNVIFEAIEGLTAEVAALRAAAPKASGKK